MGGICWISISFSHMRLCIRVFKDGRPKVDRIFLINASIRLRAINSNSDFYEVQYIVL